MINTVLVTGGTGKFGRAMLDRFLEREWQVVITSRDQLRAQALIDSVSAPADAVCGIAADFKLRGAIPMLMAELTRKQICVTHLVNNARSLDTLSVSDDGVTSRSMFLGELELDVVTPYELTMAIAKSSDHRLRAVVNIGSQYGAVAPNPALYGGSLDSSPIQYGVAKAAVNHLTRELAVRLAPSGIRVNCVAFGGVEGRVDDEFRARYAGLVPTGRMLSDREIFGPVEFLLSEASSAVNGHVLAADGGWSIW